MYHNTFIRTRALTLLIMRMLVLLWRRRLYRLRLVSGGGIEVDFNFDSGGDVLEGNTATELQKPMH